MSAASASDLHARRQIARVLAVLGVVFAVEAAGSIWTGSLALLSDAAHVLGDGLAFALSGLALVLSMRPTSRKRTFGWHRLEVLASLVNGILLLALAAGIEAAAVRRLLAPTPVRAGGMLLLALTGWVGNVLQIWILRDRRPHDLNLQSAFAHAWGDFLSSMGVLAGGFLILATGRTWIDGAVGGLIGLAILASGLRVVREALHLLLEGVPRRLDLDRVAERILSVEGVANLHNVHLWGLCSNVHALSAHVRLGKHARERNEEILEEISTRLRQEFQIEYVTLQIHCRGCSEGAMLGEVRHR